MRNFIIKYFFNFILILLLAGCLSNQNSSRNQDKGGIVFTFDDQYIDEWYNFRDKFNEYNIKATFFINRPQNLTDDQIQKLKQLANDGHEIGCHGLNHRNALDFKDSINQYYAMDIKPAIEILDSLGFTISSFAYPYGSSTEKIDSLLLQHVPYLRKATWNIQDTTIDFYNEIFANSNSYAVINSMGIDSNYRITFDNLKKGMQRAKRNNEVLILHNHCIDTIKDDYVVTPAYLEHVFQLSNQYGLKSLCISDLGGYFTNEE